ncbi:sodium-dependent glucose transporter 1 [Astatotilapia calliptera]|uniref:Major facilitator superfamily (MFS) profile domain-containing protein n=1 Tax=Astatotilapia calliptera TaxID=8154 RepID=A0A3P8QEF3_ASTCA|nr:sodium-dependent glucose transporter 1 [Astatotilapia calliptera]
MSTSVTRDTDIKKKHVHFASMEEDDNDDKEEDTLFDKRKDTGREMKNALKGAKRKTTQNSDDRVEVVGGGRGGQGAGGRWMVTLALCASCLGLGMCISVLGPTLEDLAANVNQDIGNISYIFVGRSAGYAGGSLLGGILFDCMNPHLLLGLSMLLTASGMCAIPYCKQALLLTVFMSSIGISMGVIDTGGNVLILDTWGEQSGPHLQALHFSFAAGAFVSPIIAKLVFGTDWKGTEAIAPTKSTPSTEPQVTKTVNTQGVSHSTLNSTWAYIVIGAFVFLMSFLFFILYSRCSVSRAKPRSASGKPLVAKYHVALTALLFLFFFAYVGAEVAYGSFIFTFAKEYIHMAEAKAAGLNSLFWGSFAACRGLAIFFAACMYPGNMILLSLLGTAISSLLLCFFNKKEEVLWVCTAIYGASMAAIFPSGISWVEQYTTVTGRTAAVFVVGAALGEMVLPALIGFLLERFPKHPLLMYLSLVTAIFTSILFPVMYKLASVNDEIESSESQRALLDSGADEDEDEEEQDNEADQLNDADFEVIEMDDTSNFMNSPSKMSSPPDVMALTDSPTAQTTLVSEPAGATFSESISLVGHSPRQNLLLSLDQEKGD